MGVPNSEAMKSRASAQIPAQIPAVGDNNVPVRAPLQRDRAIPSGKKEQIAVLQHDRVCDASRDRRSPLALGSLFAFVVLALCFGAALLRCMVMMPMLGRIDTPGDWLLDASGMRRPAHRSFPGERTVNRSR